MCFRTKSQKKLTLPVKQMTSEKFLVLTDDGKRAQRCRGLAEKVTEVTCDVRHLQQCDISHISKAYLAVTRVTLTHSGVPPTGGSCPYRYEQVYGVTMVTLCDVRHTVSV